MKNAARHMKLVLKRNLRIERKKSSIATPKEERYLDSVVHSKQENNVKRSA